MRKLVYFMHTSLDGFVAGINGEMDWIKFDEALFDFVGTMTANADTALYGRVTYEMMEGYWPHAAEKPNATKHDKEHSRWYSQVPKVVLSRTMAATSREGLTIMGDHVAEQITALKQRPGKNILIFGSPRASHFLLNEGLVDEFWLFVNPIILGKGIPLFKDVPECIRLQLMETKTFDCGVIALHYKKL